MYFENTSNNYIEEDDEEQEYEEQENNDEEEDNEQENNEEEDEDEEQEGFKPYSEMIDTDYNITQYTESQLYDILGFSSSPTDRELEIKILSLINKYQNNKQLSKFFNNIYDHFFEETYLEESPTVINKIQTLDRGLRDQNTNSTDVNEQKQIGLSGEIIQGLSGEQLYSTSGNYSNDVLLTNSLDYIQGKINPIKRETYFKMVLIDSKFRENRDKTLPTTYVLNLSEPITNVVSMRLYSVNIPITWYNVRSSFGSNFFYIKGNSPGINNGNHDIQIAIPSGNYDVGNSTATNIVTAINNAITNSYSTYIDTSMNGTKIEYSTPSTKMTLSTKLFKHYDGTSYNMILSDNLLSADALGFKNNTQSSYQIKSINTPITSDDNTTTRYSIDSTNNYFNIVQYNGTTDLKTHKISLTLSDGNYSRNSIYNNLADVLKTNSLLDTTISSITRDLSGIFTMTLIMNRTNLNVDVFTENSKYRIDFQETPTPGPGYIKIWTGAGSCFGFSTLDDSYNLNTVYGDIPLTSTLIEVTQGTYFELSCIKPNFEVSQNTYRFNIEPKQDPGYTLNNFINSVNTTIKTVSDTTLNLRPGGIFNITTANQNTKIDYVNSKIVFSFDIYKPFNQTNYTIDFSESPLFTSYFGFSDITPYDLSASNPIQIPNRDILFGLSLDKGRIIIRPKTSENYGNQNQSPIIIDLSNNWKDAIPSYVTGNPYNPIDAVTVLNWIFEKYSTFGTNTDNTSLVGSTFSLNQSGGKYNPIISISLVNALQESDYKVEFVNPLENDNDGNPFFSWTTDFKLDSSYNLKDYSTGTTYIDISSNSPLAITSNISLSNASITFVPWLDGVADSTGANNIVLSIPNDNYQLNTLISTINNLFTSNSLTNGSQLSTLTTNNNETYTKISININKNYTAKDYKIVWFDLTSYTSCQIGTGTGLTTTRYDSTLGWLLGFRSYTSYDLGYVYENRNNTSSNQYISNTPSVLLSDGSILITSDTAVNLNIYNNLLIILDDFIQNHVNDGLITLSSIENDTVLSNNRSKMIKGCDPVTGLPVLLNYTNFKAYNPLSSTSDFAVNVLNYEKEVRAKSVISNQRQGPNVKDVFAMIPLKPGTAGTTYVEYGGTLQNQDRKYFGPVRIQKLSVKLMNDNGEIVDLQNNDWSFGVICEIIADPSKTTNVK